MEDFSTFLAALMGGLGGMSLILFILLIFLGINFFFSILTGLLATRRNRSFINWFILTCFYGFISFLFLLFSKNLNKENHESDTLSKFLWFFLLLPIISIFFFGFM